LELRMFRVWNSGCLEFRILGDQGAAVAALVAVVVVHLVLVLVTLLRATARVQGSGFRV